MTFPLYDDPRTSDREVMPRQVLEEHFIEARHDGTDAFVALPVRAVIAPDYAIELGPVSLTPHDAELLIDSLRILTGLFPREAAA